MLLLSMINHILQLILHGQAPVKNESVLIHLRLVRGDVLIIRFIDNGLSDRGRIPVVLLIMMNICIHAGGLTTLILP